MVTKKPEYKNVNGRPVKKLKPVSKAEGKPEPKTTPKNPKSKVNKKALAKKPVKKVEIKTKGQKTPIRLSPKAKSKLAFIRMVADKNDISMSEAKKMVERMDKLPITKRRDAFLMQREKQYPDWLNLSP